MTELLHHAVELIWPLRWILVAIAAISVAAIAFDRPTVEASR